DPLFDSGVPASDYDEFPIFKKRSVTYGTVRNAPSTIFFLPRDAELFMFRARGNNHGSRLIFLISRDDRFILVTINQPFHITESIFGTEFFCMFKHFIR